MAYTTKNHATNFLSSHPSPFFNLRMRMNGMMHLRHIKKGDHVTAFQGYSELAGNGGYAHAQFNLGVMYYHGLGVNTRLHTRPMHGLT